MSLEAAFGAANAGGQILGGIAALQNAQTQRRFANAQNELALRNFYLQRQIANQQREMATAGQRDARGNSLEYVPGVGWVETASPLTQRLINASDNEDLERLTTDAVRARMLRGLQYNRQLREGAEADAILAGMGEGQQSLDDVRGVLARRNVARAMSGINNARRGIQLNMLRGGSGGEVALAELARNGIADTATALAEADAEANPEFLSRRSGRIGGTLANYNTLGSRATQPLGVENPLNNPGADMSRRLASQQQTGAFLLGNANRIQPPQQLQMNDRTPTAVGSLASAVGGLGTDPNLRPLRNFLSGMFGGSRQQASGDWLTQGPGA